MAQFLPPEHVRQVNKLEWPKWENPNENIVYLDVGCMNILKQIFIDFSVNKTIEQSDTGVVIIGNK